MSLYSQFPGVPSRRNLVHWSEWDRVPQNLTELEPSSSTRRLRRLQLIWGSGLEEGLGAFDLHRLELLGAKTEQFQNSRGDLRRLYRRRDIQAARRSGPCHQDRNVSILGVITTVLGDLARMAGIN